MVQKKKRAYRDDQIKIMKVKGLWPIPEVARKCGVEPSTVYRWIDDGKVEGSHVGAARYVKIASVKKYLGDGAPRF